LAVKIVRQANKIALIGAPTSAAALQAGHERAPEALRSAGLVQRLQGVGYEVADLGDIPVQVFQPDEEHPRARNLPAILAALSALRPLVEQAVKSGAVPLILGGDCTIALATIAGLHRYYRRVSLVWMDRDADMNVPASTPSGCVDGMVVAHISGRGAPELVRFSGEPPLVRPPEVALFGFDRLDPPEQEALDRSPFRRYPAAEVLRRGVAAAAEAALANIHATAQEFLLHFDVDVISADDFRATNYPAPGGLRAEEVSLALEVFLRHGNLAAVEVTAYNPLLDSEGSGAGLVVDMLAAAFAARLAAKSEPAPAEATAVSGVPPEAPAAAPPETPDQPAAGELSTRDAENVGGSSEEPEPSAS